MSKSIFPMNDHVQFRSFKELRVVIKDLLDNHPEYDNNSDIIRASIIHFWKIKNPKKEFDIQKLKKKHYDWYIKELTK